MSSHGISLETEISEQVQEAQAHRRDRRLSHLHRGEVRRLLGPLLGGERRRREDRAVQSVVRKLLHVGGRIPHSTCTIEGDGRMGTHANVLTSLTREDEGELADRRCPEAESNVRVGKRTLVTGAKRIRGLRDLGAEFFSRASDDCDASVRVSIERLSRFCGDETQRVTRLDLTRRLDKLGSEGLTV